MTLVSIYIWKELCKKDEKLILEHAQSLSEQIAFRLQDAIDARLKCWMSWLNGGEDWSYERYYNYSITSKILAISGRKSCIKIFFKSFELRVSSCKSKTVSFGFRISSFGFCTFCFY